MVHALRVLRHYLLGGAAPLPAVCWAAFDLRSENQAITRLETNRHPNKTHVRRLDEIEDFRFDVAHLPGARDPTDPPSRRGFADGGGPAASTGDPDPESRQELFSRLGRDAPAPALLAAIRVGWAHTRRAAAAAFANVQVGGAHPSTRLGGGAVLPPRVLVCSSLRPASGCRLPPRWRRAPP